jgi:hypothetical protein
LRSVLISTTPPFMRLFQSMIMSSRCCLSRGTFQAVSEIPEPLVCDRVMAVPKYPSNLAIRQRYLIPKGTQGKAPSRNHLLTCPCGTLSYIQMEEDNDNKFAGRDFHRPDRGFPSATAIGAASASVPILVASTIFCRRNPSLFYICRWLEAGRNPSRKHLRDPPTTASMC